LFTSFKEIWTIVVITWSFESRIRNLTGLHFTVLVSIGTCRLHWFVSHTTVRFEEVCQSSVNYRSKWTGLQSWQLFYHVVKILSAFCSSCIYYDCVRMSRSV